MEDAAYLRSQAAMCLELARHISDLRASTSLRAEAAEHLRRAEEFERLAQNASRRNAPKN